MQTPAVHPEAPETRLHHTTHPTANVKDTAKNTAVTRASADDTAACDNDFRRLSTTSEYTTHPTTLAMPLSTPLATLAALPSSRSQSFNADAVRSPAHAIQRMHEQQNKRKVPEGCREAQNSPQSQRHALAHNSAAGVSVGGVAIRGENAGFNVDDDSTTVHAPHASPDHTPHTNDESAQRVAIGGAASGPSTDLCGVGSAIHTSEANMNASHALPLGADRPPARASTGVGPGQAYSLDERAATVAGSSVDKQFTLGYLNAMVLCAHNGGNDPDISAAMLKLNQAVSNRLYGSGSL